MKRIVAAAAVIVAACSGAAPPSTTVVATTTILGDYVASIVAGCGELRVVALVPNGQDPHGYQPSARDRAVLAEALLVVANGLGLEAAMDPVLDATEADGTALLRIGPSVDPLTVGESSPTDASLGVDPHVWFDPLRMADGVGVVTDRLVELLPEEEACLRRAAAAYRAEIVDAHETIVELLSAIPPERRTLVTNHDSLRYFADRYGFRIAATVIPSATTRSEPSPAELAAVVETIRRTGTPAIFADTTAPTRLAEAVAAEVGRPVAVVPLFTGSLGPAGSGADGYPEMLVEDARRIAEALAASASQ